MEVIPLLIWLALVILIVAGVWKTFEKAGQPGWAAIIPFYNMYVMTQVAQLEIIWFILLFIPIANIVASVMISMKIAEAFGKSGGFGIGLWLLPIIFFPILGFGSAKYFETGAPAAPAAPPVQPPTEQSAPPPPMN